MKRVLFVLFSFVFISSAYAESSTFSKLMAAGKSVQCDFQKKDGSQKGTIYVSEAMMRGDFQVKQGATEYPMHMIRDPQNMYTWGGPMGEGMGMVMPAAMGQSGSPMAGSQSNNMDEVMDFTCQDWTADPSKFETPPDVTFQDLSQFMSGHIPQQQENS